jgi:hypothetical protein
VGLAVGACGEGEGRAAPETAKEAVLSGDEFGGLKTFGTEAAPEQPAKTSAKRATAGCQKRIRMLPSPSPFSVKL